MYCAWRFIVIKWKEIITKTLETCFYKPNINFLPSLHNQTFLTNTIWENDKMMYYCFYLSIVTLHWHYTIKDKYAFVINNTFIVFMLLMSISITMFECFHTSCNFNKSYQMWNVYLILKRMNSSKIINLVQISFPSIFKNIYSEYILLPLILNDMKNASKKPLGWKYLSLNHINLSFLWSINQLM